MRRCYVNGNAQITLLTDGTRIINYKDKLTLEYPLNVDIRVQNGCSFANTLCKDFCHEMPSVKGNECDYDLLLTRLQSELNTNVELAIGCNELTEGIMTFCRNASAIGFIINLTINQGHLSRDLFGLLQLIEEKAIQGLGISYRSALKWNVPLEIMNYENTVFHVIVGIDGVVDLDILIGKGVKKVLLLGEKDFGFNKSKVNTDSKNHKELRNKLHNYISKFKVISFDNLALEQLPVSNLLSEKDWSKFYQSENSFYINAVDGYLSPSSRSSNKSDFLTNFKDYYGKRR